MQRGLSYRKGVCLSLYPSVRLSVCLSVRHMRELCYFSVLHIRLLCANKNFLLTYLLILSEIGHVEICGRDW